MGRTRKPHSHLELAGSFKAHPERKRAPGPVSEGDIGPPPTPLTPEQVAAWDYLVSIAPPGLLTRMDAAYLAMCAIALAGVWHYNPDDNGGKPLSAAALANVGRMLSKLGMSPTDRHSVEITPPKMPNPYAKFKKAGQIDDDDDDFEVL